MIDLYCELIINTRRTFETIPNEFKEEVELRLAELGYNTDGSLIKGDDE